MKFGIVGTGCMGSVYAGLLARAGHEVWALDTNRPHLDAIARKGLTVTGASGDHVATTIRVGDVVRRMEGDLAPVECLRASGGTCLIASCCRLKGALSRAMGAYLAVLDGVTIAELVEENGALALLLGEAA